MIAVRSFALLLCSTALAMLAVHLDPVHGPITAGIALTLGFGLSIALAAWGE